MAEFDGGAEQKTKPATAAGGLDRRRTCEPYGQGQQRQPRCLSITTNGGAAQNENGFTLRPCCEYTNSAHFWQPDQPENARHQPLPAGTLHEVCMKSIRIFAVGSIKSPLWRAAADHYKKRLSHFLRLEEIEIKDADAGLSPEMRKERETMRLLGLLRSPDMPICLDERGAAHDSRGFANLLRRLFEAGKRPCFIIGGPYGLAEAARTAAAHCLSLGPMTFPHELARIILLEQIYRAENILAGTGYHH